MTLPSESTRVNIVAGVHFQVISAGNTPEIVTICAMVDIGVSKSAAVVCVEPNLQRGRRGGFRFSLQRSPAEGAATASGCSLLHAA